MGLNMASAARTRNHEKIREWAEARGGKPARVKGTKGLLRIDFGDPEQTLEQISWDDFFDRFDEADLDFLFSAEDQNRFNKFVRH
jgi:hypothetical protein